MPRVLVVLLLLLVPAGRAAAAELVPVPGAQALAYGRSAAGLGDGWTVTASGQDGGLFVREVGPAGPPVLFPIPLASDGWGATRVAVGGGLVAVAALRVDPCNGCNRKYDPPFITGGVLLAGRLGQALRVIARDQVIGRTPRAWALSGGRLLTLPEGPYGDLLHPPLPTELDAWTPETGLTPIFTAAAGLTGLTADAMGALFVEGAGNADARLLDVPPGGVPAERLRVAGLLAAVGSPSGAYLRRTVKDATVGRTEEVTTRDGAPVLPPRAVPGTLELDDDGRLWSASDGLLRLDTPGREQRVIAAQGIDALLGPGPRGGVLVRSARDVTGGRVLQRIAPDGEATTLSWVTRGTLSGAAAGPGAVVVSETDLEQDVGWGDVQEPGCVALVAIPPDAGSIPRRPAGFPCPDELVDAGASLDRYTRSSAPIGRGRRLRVSVQCTSGVQADGGCAGSLAVYAARRGRRGTLLARTAAVTGRHSVLVGPAARTALRRSGRTIRVEVRSPTGALTSERRSILR